VYNVAKFDPTETEERFMMKLKMFAMMLLTGALMSACSESTYTPYTNAGLNGTQTGMYNNPAYPNAYNTNNAINPYLNNNLNMGMNNNMQMQAQAQASFRLQFRVATPNYYMPNYTNNNCMMRTQVNYTPTQCACFTAPCNCQQVLSQVRQQTVQSTQARTRSCNTCTTTRTRTTSNEPTNDDTTTADRTTQTTNTSTRMSLSLVNEDAQALFERLAKEEVVVVKKETVKRVGLNFKCFQDTDRKKFIGITTKKDDSFACDFDINLTDGSLMVWSDAGKSGQPVKTDSTLYTGKNLNIGGPGMNPSEGVFKVSGATASAIFKRLPGVATEGKVDAEGKIDATIKLGKHLKCYEMTNTVQKTTECQIKLNTETGEALDAQLI
jgi:hypothetical protein